MGGQHLDADLVGVQQFINVDGQQVLGLQRVGGGGLLEELHKAGFQQLHELGGQRPHVHRNKAVDVDAFAACGCAVGGLFNAAGLQHAGQVVGVVHLADAAGDRAVVAQGVFQHKARHGKVARLVGRVALQEVVQPDERLLAVVVVGVDDGERLLNNALAGQHGLAGAPGLGAALRHGEALRHVLECLERIVDLNAQPGADLLNAVTDGLFKRLLNVVADDKDDLVKTGLDGVMNGIVHDDLAVGTDGSQLFDAAAEAGADTGGHNHQCSFHSFLLN